MTEHEVERLREENRALRSLIEEINKRTITLEKKLRECREDLYLEQFKNKKLRKKNNIKRSLQLFNQFRGDEK